MAFPTILILGLLVSTIPIITCQLDSLEAETSDASDENANIVIPGDNETIVPIKEMSYRRNTFNCPAVFGRFPHPASCEYYFECRNGYPTLWHCNRGYLYDRERKQCRDWRYVKCQIKDKVNDVKEDVRYFRCPDIWGLYPHPYDCSKYYVCDKWYPILYQCYPNFLFDAYYRHCLPSHKVNCGSRLNRDQLRTTPRPQVTTTTIQPWEIKTIAPKTNKFYCPFPYGYFPDPEDCSRFYECRYSVTHLHKCPGTTLYDERKEQCLDKTKVKCNGRPGGNNHETGIEIKVDVRCPYDFGIFVHPIDCSKYIICIYNTPSVFNCRKNELFDAYYRRCLPEDKVSCNERINPDNPYPTRKTTTPILTTTTTPEPTTTSTPTTTTPVPTTASTTDIDKSSTTQPVTKPNTPPPTDCKEDDLDCILDETGDVSGWYDCPKRFGHYPHGSSRQLFIHCDNWKPFVKRCADNTHFSPIYLVCVWENKKQ